MDTDKGHGEEGQKDDEGELHFQMRGKVRASLRVGRFREQRVGIEAFITRGRARTQRFVAQ